ncbi:calpain, putative [Plasmodium gallinaceum]|uniref:Calpain, putative n=1 Tax=Plasmodium gallinaceum TaxID=5849 RepID=A0A1J1GNK9_PLAGA|nr:calpain, putative [Plasmodium gallinaceum]CRG93981.1 calpain, putative [Plasmodium gallinaceum]
MGCAFSKVKEKKGNDKSNSIKVSTDNYNELKIDILNEGATSTISNTKRETYKNKFNEVSNKYAVKNSNTNNNNEIIKNSTKGFTQLNDKKKGEEQRNKYQKTSLLKSKKFIEEKKKEKEKEKQIEQIEVIKYKEKKKEYEKKEEIICKTKYKEVEKTEKQNKRKERQKNNEENIKEKEKEKEKENKFENNSFKGIINTINNNLIKKKCSSRDKKNCSSICKIEGLLLEKKKKLLCKNKKEIFIKENKNKNEKNNNFWMNYKNKEEKMNANEKNKEVLLYYHDFKNIKLKKNYFMYIYEFYKYNNNAFNLFSLMPSHIAENTHASKILFESSLIGKYIILPWIENDPDIKNNLYLKYVLNYIQKKKELGCINDYEENGEINYCGFFQNKNEHIETNNLLRYSSANKNYLWKFESENTLKRKICSINRSGKSIKKKDNKYINNRNLSIDNLYKLHIRKDSLCKLKNSKTKKKKKINIKNVKTINNYIETGIDDRCIKEKNSSNKDKNIKKLGESPTQKKKENNKIHSINKLEYCENSNLKKGKNENREKISEKEKIIKMTLEDKIEKKELNEQINDEILDYNLNNYAYIENGKVKSKHNNSKEGVLNNNYTNKYDYYIASIEHTKKKNSRENNVNMKNKNDIKIIKKKKNVVKPSFSFEDNMKMMLTNKTLELQSHLKIKKGVIEKEKEKKEETMKNKREKGAKCKKEKEVKKVNDNEYKKKDISSTINEIDEEYNKRKKKESKEENYNKKVISKKYNEVNYNKHLKNKNVNDYNIQNVNIKAKRINEIHKMAYEEITTKRKSKYKKIKELKSENYSDGNFYLNKKKDNNNNNKVDQMTKNEFNQMNKLEITRNTLKECDHKYKLNENCIKKNYMSCGKCNKKRCIFHYLNRFKLYGWLNFKWTDPDGFLELSNRQKKKFYAWKRLSDLYDNPIVMSTDLYNNCIRQGFVADCSFLSSLTVLIEYEKKHKIPVLSSIISPCTSHYLYVNKTWPIFNPSGMYICRLHCNGIQRKIIIDDYVPVKINNALLVAYSNNQKELWVTLLEKAFVKLMGGSYSMFGSNPGSDLYYLTGWIPVTISFKSKVRSSPPSFDKSTIHSLQKKKSKIKKNEFSKLKYFIERINENKQNNLNKCVRNIHNKREGVKKASRIKKGEKLKCKNKKVIKRRQLVVHSMKKNNYTNMIYNSNNLCILNDNTLKSCVNLNLHRLHRNSNYSYLRKDFIKYRKLKIYWNFKRLYLSQKKKINKSINSVFMKNQNGKKYIEDSYNVEYLSSLNTQISDNLIEKNSIKNKNKEINSVNFNLENNVLMEHSSMRTNLKEVNLKNTTLMSTCKFNTNLVSIDSIRDISMKCDSFYINKVKKKLHKEDKDYEICKNYGNKFINEEVSNMDLSSYICGSIDNYSDLNKKGDSLIQETESEEYDKRWDIIWNHIYDGIKKGKCVVCLGTLELKDAAPSGLDYPEGVSMSTGIVTRHAYSILNIETHNEDKLLYIKNPWGCIRWKGKYSHHDVTTWTKELQRKLNYSIEKAKSKDDGCFWIPWKDVVKYFSHIYICWNSVIFAYQFEIHTKWENSAFLNSSILLDDTHLVAYNPQFALHVNVRKQDLSEDGLYYIGKKPIEIWVLLSRHVKERKTDVSQKYLALHVHAGKDRIICPLFPIKQGIYSNGECTFTKLVIGGIEDNYNYDVKKQKNTTSFNENNFNVSLESEQEVLRNVDFVLIVSQYSQKEEFNFTLKVFSHTHLSLYELPPLMPENYESFYFKGEWTNKSAGGCSNNLWSYFRNPHIRFYVPEESPFCIFLECSQEHSVNLRIFKGITSSPRGLKKGEVISSGAYKAGCCYIECTLKSGVYCLIPSLYRANTTGNYQICIHYPKFKQKPILYFIPYAYTLPPFSIFKYEVIHLCSLKNYSVILFHTTSVTLLSLRITFFQNVDIKGIPLVNIYKLVNSTDTITNDCENGNIIKNNSFNTTISYNGSIYKIIEKCNIHGSSGNNILPLSTCAYDYYIKFNSVLISLVELEDDLTSYLLLITTNIKEDILYNHEAHFISDKPVIIDKYYPIH